MPLKDFVKTELNPTWLFKEPSKKASKKEENPLVKSEKLLKSLEWVVP